MWLNVVWFALFVIIIAGYLIMDGFDLGVGILHPFLARNDEERRVFLNSIGPVWDGNEVWLVLGGGALFAAFPLVYASLFSGLYIAMMLVLLVLILRTVAIEFRSKRPSPAWRSFWDGVFFAASLGIALLLGVAFGNILDGLPIAADGYIRANLYDLLTPYALLVGVTTIFMLATHGAIYLSMKASGALLDRVKHWVPRLMIAFFALNTVLVGVTALVHETVSDRYWSQPWLVILPGAALLSVIVAWLMVRRQRYFVAFFFSAAMIAGLLISAAVGLYPNLLVSTLNSSYNLTIFNAASQPNTLTVMLIMALIGMPFVLLYTAGVYYIFRGRVQIGPNSY
ncbi:MAG TPA: cytochrome d ubiquinol oxidase subunit II [Chloroflexi bacterium]|nr:cytochrome d ubiquinol oxidase subunit II [Chloroflexota bacterium]HHW86771.1 cytochrome d ubiquinol oxidase subunit II [Chloroflexota bacterium]